MRAAAAHPLGGRDGFAIMEDHHSYLWTKQMVGVIACDGCSIEILPKVGVDQAQTPNAARQQLVRILDTVLALKVGFGQKAPIERQGENLLEVVVRYFADALLLETHRGLPRRYVPHEEDLPSLRGRINVTRQFSVLAVRPDRLASRFDALSSDIPLLQIMSACVRFLMRRTRNQETKRRLGELRFVMSEVSDVPLGSLPWQAVSINRTNYRWKTLFDIAQLLLKRDWQATHRDPEASEGLSLLFPMNDLFEGYIDVLLRREASLHNGVEIKAQSGLKNCVTDQATGRGYFQTKPDFLIISGGKVRVVVDTKWKRIDAAAQDAKHGVKQGDVYQMIAYSRLYDCPELTLLYPHHERLGEKPLNKRLHVNGGANADTLSIASIDVFASTDNVRTQLSELFLQPINTHRALV